MIHLSRIRLFFPFLRRKGRCRPPLRLSLTEIISVASSYLYQNHKTQGLTFGFKEKTVFVTLGYIDSP